MQCSVVVCASGKVLMTGKGWFVFRVTGKLEEGVHFVLVDKSKHFTGGHVGLHILPTYSCIYQALSVGRPLPVAGRSSLSPGTRLGWQFGSLSASVHHVNAWQPCCSFCAWPSIFHPAHLLKDKRGQDIRFRR
ncbi:hypothetical protein GDO86_018346 [Hymenochirus boettgeri]|uniref:Uncharacterized protein n=1 Tax=Hymenochirus boettgeri TaxID=247094 RepID=A0A8T2I914_9PIPI|nr:hypothetical protein GDO86_018346 [Hymenochirus boettgeri]